MTERFALAASLVTCQLTAGQLARFDRFSSLLSEWNRRFNLSSVPEDEVETRHFLDSLSLAPVLRTLSGFPHHISLLDVGSGAGLPGIPLKIAFPDLHIVLLEATGKKTAFLRQVVDALGLTGVDVVRARAEEAGRDPSMRESFAAVVARAVAPLATLAELCLPFVRVGGVFIAMKKGDTESEVECAGTAISLLGGTCESREVVVLPGLEDDRHLLVVRKTSATPARFPRRSGMPAKRPL